MQSNFSGIEFIFCSFFPVGLDEYGDYFVRRFDKFTYLRWKFPHSRDKKSCSAIQYYLHGNKVKERKILYLPTFRGKLSYFISLPFSYLVYFVQAVFYLGILSKGRSARRSVFMGINYFCTFCGLFLRKIGRVDFVIYRVMDFFPLPASGVYRQLNKVFFLLDKFCLDHSDAIWFTTKGHLLGREKYGYFNRSNYKYQMIPLGIDTKKFVDVPVNDDNQFSLVYCGVVSRYHMLDLVFEVLQRLKKKYRKIKLNIVGSGPDVDYFQDLSKRMGLERNVIFHGFMEDSADFRNLMANNALGFALYRDEENFMKYTEPAKVKYYLTFGIPAIISDVPVIAKELDKKRICFAVKNRKEEIVSKIEEYILSKKLQNEYKDNIKKFIKTVDVESLLDETFKNTLNLWIQRKY